MALRLFVDHCVSRSAARSLEDAGYEVLLLRDHLPTDAPDSEVIDKAQQLDAILLSLNGDFADIVNYPPGSYNGIIALQVRNHPEVLSQILDKLKAYLAAHSDAAHYVGKLFLVEPHRIRVKS